MYLSPASLIADLILNSDYANGMCVNLSNGLRRVDKCGRQTTQRKQRFRQKNSQNSAGKTHYAWKTLAV